MAIERCHVIGAHHVVYAHIHTIPMIGEARSFSSGYVAVCQVFCYGAVRIREGDIIEVTAQYDAPSLVKADESGYGICLSSAYLCSVDELSCHEFGLPFYSAILGSTFHHVAKVLLFLGGEMV